MATPTLVATDAVDGSGVSAPRLQTIDGIGPAGLSRDAVANGSQIVTLDCEQWPDCAAFLACFWCLMFGVLSING